MEFDSAVKMNQVSLLHEGNYLNRHACNTLIDVQGRILICSQNKGFQVITETQWEEIFHDVSSRGVKIAYCAFPSVAKGCKSLLKPGKETGVPLVLYRKGENAMLRVNNEERTGSITDIHSVVIQNGDATESIHLFVEAQLYQHVTDENGNAAYHSGSQSQCLCWPQTIQMVHSINVLRKVILYPD